MNNVPALTTMGFTIPTRAYLFGAIIFSVVGYAAYRYGKRNELMHPKWIGADMVAVPDRCRIVRGLVCFSRIEIALFIDSDLMPSQVASINTR